LNPQSLQAELLAHHEALRDCHQCPAMFGPAVHGEACISPVVMIGQAPGFKEIEVHKPFAWTAGKTLFKWFNSIGLDEEEFRERVYMTAVARCFPGKNPKGGDRVPDPLEIQRCGHWLHREVDLLQPQLMIPVGKLAILQWLDCKRLNEVIGQQHRVTINGHEVDMIPLPHPSGASTWHRMEPGKTLLQEALQLLHQHPAWQSLLNLSATDSSASNC